MATWFRRPIMGGLRQEKGDGGSGNMRLRDVMSRTFRHGKGRPALVPRSKVAGAAFTYR
jgi:hypothetical protein